MDFGEKTIKDCLNAYLAHSFAHDELRIKKGTQLTQAHLDRLSGLGVKSLIVAKLSDEDLHEDEAANLMGEWCISKDIRREDAFTGRVNFYAEHAGMFCVDSAVVTKINAVHPAITLATLHNQEPVEAGRMLGTLKIIPFAAPKAACDAVCNILKEALPFEMKLFARKRVGVISTELAHLKQSTIDKTLKTLAARLRFAGSMIATSKQVNHDVDALKAAIKEMEKTCDLVIIFGASATIDAHDVTPMAIEQAGGVIERYGMPVDPGNLLVLGSIGDKPVIGAPGCARSSAENGFDFVLYRLLSNQVISDSDIAGMGVGGLLKEIHSRPQPRELQPRELKDTIDMSKNPKIAALILAGGQSRRMGEENKLLMSYKGKSLLSYVVEAAEQSNCSKSLVVTGHQADAIKQELSEHDVTYVHNPDYDKGLSTSIFAGINALKDDLGEIDGVIVLLGDMPRICDQMINQMIEKFDKAAGITIVQAAHKGKGGNPVLWGAQYFEALLNLEGDMGARPLIARYESALTQVELGASVFLDVDTKEAFQSLADEQ